VPLTSRLVPLDALRPFAAPILWSIYVAIPVRGAGWLDGVPLEPIEAAAIALVWWAWAVDRHLAGRWLLLSLVVVKTALAGMLVDRGFEARYYPNDAWSAPHARSSEFGSERYTRIDRQIAFGAEGRPDLPLHFFNELGFNYYRPTEPARERLPYSVVWDGFLFLDEERPSATVYVAADETASSALWIDGRPVIAPGRASQRTATISLARGWHALRLSVAAPQGAGRRIEAGEMVGGVSRPFDAGRAFVQPVGALRRAVDATARVTLRALDLALLAWLGATVLLRARRALRERRLGRLLWLGAIAEALRYAWPYAGRVTVLSGGGDMLVYEHLSRVILSGDVLLAAGGPGGGQGTAFHFQPLYPYFLALAHGLFGEDLFGVVLLQRVLVAATVAWAAALTAQLFGPRAGWIAVVGGGLLAYARVGRWSDVLLAEPLFAPIFVGWTLMLVRLTFSPPAAARLLLTGLVGGVATLIRSTLLLAWPVILPLWWRSLPARRSRLAAGLLVSMMAVVGLATLRNWMVADVFVPITAGFGFNLYLGNQSTQPVGPPPPWRAAVYNAVGLGEHIGYVTEFAIQTPALFARGLGNKALYSVGFFGWSGLPGGVGMSWLYVMTWALAAVGVGRILRAAPRPGGAAVWLPAAGALSHFAAVVLVFPHGYTDRLVMPLYPLLIPYAAFALEPLPHAIGSATARLGPALAVATARARMHAGFVTPLWRRPRNWLYIAYAAAASQSPDPLTALILPSAALAVATVSRWDLLHRLIAGSLWAGALVHVAAAGSLSAEALHDPLFWGAMAAVALGASAGIGRWRTMAAAAAAVAGGLTMTALLLPHLPGFETDFVGVDGITTTGLADALSRQLGPLAALCLVGLWLRAILGIGTGRAGVTRVATATRGALLVALGLSLAGAVPGGGIDPRLWLAGLGALLGLAEARPDGPGSRTGLIRSSPPHRPIGAEARR